jgi:hypothetical protein
MHLFSNNVGGQGKQMKYIGEINKDNEMEIFKRYVKNRLKS